MKLPYYFFWFTIFTCHYILWKHIYFRFIKKQYVLPSLYILSTRFRWLSEGSAEISIGYFYQLWYWRIKTFILSYSIRIYHLLYNKPHLSLIDNFFLMIYKMALSMLSKIFRKNIEQDAKSVCTFLLYFSLSAWLKAQWTTAILSLADIFRLYNDLQRAYFPRINGYCFYHGFYLPLLCWYS